MTEWLVDLTPSEMAMAAQVGSARLIWRMQQGWDAANGEEPRNAWSRWIEGAAGEIAVGKRLRIYWDPVVGETDRDDVGPFQVRTNISRSLRDTILRPNDKPDRYYISVLSFMPRMIIIGFIWGEQAKQQKYLRSTNDGRPAAYFVPASELTDLSKLPGSRRLALIAPAEEEASHDSVMFTNVWTNTHMQNAV